MNNNKYLLEELRRELIQTYKRDLKPPSEPIWTDATCLAFAKHIMGVLDLLYKDGVKKTTDHMVSESTVQRIVTGKLELKDKIHAKTRHTLNNLCMFLGYWTWDDFENKKTQVIGIYDFETKSRNKGETLNNDEKEKVFHYMKLFEQARTAEFEMYKELRPDNLNHMDKLKDYFVEAGPEYTRIKNFCKRMFFGIFEFHGYRSKFTIDAGVINELLGVTGLLVRVFTHQEWLDKSTALNSYYCSLYTFQYVTFSPDDKIFKITYLPTCKRDEKYVQSVFGSHYELAPEDQCTPSPDMNK